MMLYDYTLSKLPVARSNDATKPPQSEHVILFSFVESRFLVDDLARPEART